MNRTRPRPRGGSILIVAMIVMFSLAVMTLVLCRSMRVEMSPVASMRSGGNFAAALALRLKSYRAFWLSDAR